MKKSFRLATVLGIPVEINYTWFIIFGLITWTLARGYFPIVTPELSTLTHWIMAVISALLLFLCLLAHELTHSYVAVRSNLPIKGITLFIFGGVAHMTKEPPDPKTEFVMAIAGPIMSFSLSLIFWILTLVFYNLKLPMPVVAVTNYLYLLNGIVGIFNLIPGFPLDGGRVLRAGLWSYFRDLKRATKIASNFGKGFAYLLMSVGLLYLFIGAFLSGIWLIFIGLFLQEAASMSYQQIVMKKALTGVKVSDIMTKEVITVPGEIMLNTLVDEYFFRFRYTSFPVISEDRLLGLITLHAVKEIPKDKWNLTKASDVMLPIAESLVVPPDTEIVDALTKMATSGIGRLLVIEDSRLIGIVSQRDIMRLFEVKADLGGE